MFDSHTMNGYENPSYKKGVCDRCGAMVAKPSKHDAWHRTQVELMVNISNAIANLQFGLSPHLTVEIDVEEGEEDAS